MSDEDTDYEYKKTLYEAYVDQRKEADRFALEIGGRYDRTVSLVAGGALVVSLTFIENIAPSPVDYSGFIILASWILLSLAILASLRAIYSSQNAIQRKMEILDDEYLAVTGKIDPTAVDTSNKHLRTITICGIVSLWGTIFGILLLVLFAFVNIPNNVMNSEENDEKYESCANDGSYKPVKSYIAPPKPPKQKDKSKSNE